MSRIQDKFRKLRANKQKALISYIVAGYPNEQGTISSVRGLVKGGTDIIELGLPFSDPLADGPVIQNASFEALKKGMSFNKFIKIVRRIRKETDIPLVLMTYSNLLYHRGYNKFLSAIKDAGIDGLILPDMAIDEAKEFLLEARKKNLDTIFLISPNTLPERIKKIADASSGFLYLVSVFGTTGVQRKFEDYTLHAIKAAKNIVSGKIPLAVGFGVSSPEQVKFIIQNGADAIIVGSAFLRLIEKTPQPKIEEKIRSFASDLKKATIYNKK